MNEIIKTEDNSMVAILQKSQIDLQISTAKAYPRSLATVQNNITTMATLDQVSARECIYALPRGGKTIKGPSVRFTEILNQAYGNCRSAARVVHVDKTDKFIEAEGMFHDLESNSVTTSLVRRKISDRKGKLYNDDMIIMTGNAACSIAKRNAILAGIPKPLWRGSMEKVEATAIGKHETLSESLDNAKKAFGAMSVTIDEICASLGVPSEKDITTDHILILLGMHSALINNEATVDEMFRPQAPTKNKSAMADNYTKKLETKKDGFDDAVIDAEIDKLEGKSDKAATNSDKPADTPELTSQEKETLLGYVKDIYQQKDMDAVTASHERWRDTVWAKDFPDGVSDIMKQESQGIMKSIKAVFDGEQEKDISLEFYENMLEAK